MKDPSLWCDEWRTKDVKEDVTIHCKKSSFIISIDLPLISYKLVHVRYLTIHHSICLKSDKVVHGQVPCYAYIILLEQSPFLVALSTRKKRALPRIYFVLLFLLFWCWLNNKWVPYLVNNNGVKKQYQNLFLLLPFRHIVCRLFGAGIISISDLFLLHSIS